LTAVRPASAGLQRPALGWALYDWANSAFALSVMTAFVPVLLAGLWSDGAPSSVGTFRLGLANGLASLLVAVAAPVLGALADRSGRRKAWLLWITALGVASTASLALVAAGRWQLGLGLYVLASLAFAAANSLYDSLLVDVAAPHEFDRVSSLGYGLGYLGGALLFTFNVVMVSRPALFGLASADEALRLAFPLVAGWWLLFSVPLALWVHDDPAVEGGPGALAAGFRQLGETLATLRREPDVLRFLGAYWLYIDAVYTIIKMAVDFGLSIGLTPQDLIQAILVTNFVAFPAALAFGRLAEAIGARAGIYLGLGVYVLATVAAAFIDTAPEFYALAVAVGLVQGGVQSLSRSYFARMVPVARTAEYFGLYNMLGKFAAIIGPVLTGTVALLAGSQRLGLLSLLLLLLGGAWLLTRVRVPAAPGSGAPSARAHG
jgi:UMF1 family MFS transporter